MYKKRYYNYFFPKMKINDICKEYLEGISWVKHYYLTDCPDWLWLYKHHQAPFISDIYQYLIKNPVPEIKIIDNKSI